MITVPVPLGGDRAYDVLVGPALSVVGFDRSKPVPSGDGNVLEPQPESERLRGGYPGVVTRVGRQAAAG